MTLTRGSNKSSTTYRPWGQALQSATDAAFDALSPPKRLSPSQWAENNRHLSNDLTAEPGPWRNDRAPYLVGMMDAIKEPGVEMIVVKKPTQVGFSEALRNILGYWIECDPGPTLLVMPSEQTARESIEERVKPLLGDTPSLRRRISSRADDTKLSAIKLDSMTIYTGWAGSPQSLATRPCRYLGLDEVDKYPAFAGKEADPIRLALKRIETYGHRARTIIGSTPTTRDGHISKWFDGCGDQRHYHVPCPRCGVHQTMEWSQVKWPKSEEKDKAKRADDIETNRLAWYECVSCGRHVRDGAKPGMLRRGVWVGKDQVVTDDGRVVGRRQPTKRVGFHLNSIYSPWVTFSRLAAEFILAKGDPAAMMDFRNSRLAEVFEERLAGTSSAAIRDKVAAAPEPDIVPSWATALICTADTQKDHFFWTIRAWGFEYRSSLVANGICHTFDELEAVGLNGQFRQDETGVMWTPNKQLIDSGGSRTNEVYEYVLRDPGRIHAVKGASHAMSRPWKANPQPNGVVLVNLDTGWFKDMLTRLIGDPDTAKWMPHKQVDDDYCHQMASEHKVFNRKTGKQIWVPVGAGMANHYWDCETYQTAAAYMFNVSYIAPPEPAKGGRDEDREHAGDGRRWTPSGYAGKW